MPKLKPNQVPAYRLHKHSGQAIVTLSGKDHLLGKHGTRRAARSTTASSASGSPTAAAPRTAASRA